MSCPVAGTQTRQLPVLPARYANFYMITGQVLVHLISVSAFHAAASMLILPLLPGGRFRALTNRKQRPCIAFCVAKRAWRISCWWPEVIPAWTHVDFRGSWVRDALEANHHFALTNKEAGGQA